MNIALVTDSTADIPPEIVAQHNIQVVPAIIVIDGQNVEDGEGISRRDFYDRMPDMHTHPTTSTPSAGAFHKVYQKLLEAGAQAIISLHVASPLSGIFNTAKMAAQEFGERVHVIDSHSISMGLGYQVLAAAEAIQKNIPLDQIQTQLADFQQRIRVYAMLDTLENIRRSGRVSWVSARLGSLLRIKLFVEVKDGSVLNLGQARTRKKAIEHLKNLIHKLGDVEKLTLLHSNAEADARQILSDLNFKLGTPPLVVNVTPVIGTHVGPNGLGIAAVLK
jgi:DegV family protein with EDD domain